MNAIVFSLTLRNFYFEWGYFDLSGFNWRFFRSIDQEKYVSNIPATFFSFVFSTCLLITAPALSSPPIETASSNKIPSTLISHHNTNTQKKPILIAIIIDDIGYNFERGKRATELPGQVTLAIIPHTTNSKLLANLAHKNKKEVMVHAPMSNVSGSPLDKGALTGEMGYFLFSETLRQNINAIPYAKGVNNHMGSLLTQQVIPMTWLMEELSKDNLYFVDSRTSSKSIAWQTAQTFGLPTAKRDFFLDNDRDYISIAKQFGKFISQAQARGTGIAIGHPYPETLNFLKHTLPKLNASGIRLVPVSNLLSQSPYKPLSQSIARKSRVDGDLDYFTLF